MVAFAVSVSLSSFVCELWRLGRLLCVDQISRWALGATSRVVWLSFFAVGRTIKDRHTKFLQKTMEPGQFGVHHYLSVVDDSSVTNRIVWAIWTTSLVGRAIHSTSTVRRASHRPSEAPELPRSVGDRRRPVIRPWALPWPNNSISDILHCLR